MTWSAECGRVEYFVATAKLDGTFLAKWVGQLQLNHMLENTGPGSAFMIVSCFSLSELLICSLYVLHKRRDHPPHTRLALKS